MKKKICSWLNSNESGGLVLRHGVIDACCTQNIRLIDDSQSYCDLTYEQIQDKRIDLVNRINNDCNECKNCGFLHEVDEEKIDIGKLSYIIYHPHKTCNLCCCYCSHAKNGFVNEHFESEKFNPLELISHFHNIGMFKDTINFEFGGGEPLILNNIPEAINFLSEYYPKSTVIFVSNFSLKKQANDLINVLQNRKIHSKLKTSIDCGTRETYKKIRGRDLYDTVVENIINAAKNNAFDEIMLKYIFLEDGSNASYKDVNGFINLVKKVKKVNPNKTTVILDADMSSLYKTTFTEDKLSKKVLFAASRIYASFRNDISWQSERFSSSRPNGLKHINEIKKYSLLSYQNICENSQKLLTILKLLH